MRTVPAAVALVLTLPLYAAAPSGQIAMGVGATDSSSIIVRMDGKESPVTLAGVTSGSERGAAFLKRLVAGRVVRVNGPRSAATATLLDNTSVAGHVNDFLQTSTTSDPCTLGRAAYNVALPLVARRQSAAPARATKAAKAAAPKREAHVSFAAGKSDPNNLSVKGSNPAVSAAYTAPAPTPKPANQPGAYNLPQATTYTPPQASPLTSLPQGAAQTLQGAAPPRATLPQPNTEAPNAAPRPTTPTTTY